LLGRVIAQVWIQAWILLPSWFIKSNTLKSDKLQKNGLVGGWKTLTLAAVLNE
jgi:hypothetical protein